MKKIKISILSHNLSDNCVGRAYILAKALASDYEVEIIGPAQSSGIWKPVADDASITYKQLGRFLNPIGFLNALDGDILYAIKPRTASFGYALLAKIFKGKKIVLDIDDWEIGFFKDFHFIGRIIDVLRFWNYDNFVFTWLMEKCIPFADAITISNTFLQKRFGGIMIPHFKDTAAFNPDKFDREALRNKFSVQNKKVVMFLGTIRKHKGIDTLIAAFDSMKRSDAILMLVGVDEKTKASLPKRDYLIVMGPQPFERIPEFLAVADLIVLMQKTKSPATQGQLPAKIFDAMSMAKPIIASNVSDMPSILNGCGIVISDDKDELVKSINLILDNPELAKTMGLAARQRCIEGYSYEAIKPRLLSIFRDINK